MASPDAESKFSRFQNVFQSLPQGHDKALKQAFYNTAATLFAVIVCCAGVAVYYILEAFLRPLLWAVLCGAFLHPFKNTLTSVVQGWLKSMRTSGTPLAVGTVLLPIQLLNGLTETLASVLFAQYKVIIGASIALPLAYIVYYFGPMQQIFAILQSTFYFVYDALGYFNALWVWTLVVAYVVVVAFYWTPQSSRWLRLLAVPVWAALLFHFASVAGPLRVPIVIATAALMVIGFVAEVNEARRKSQKIGASKRQWKLSENIHTIVQEEDSEEQTLLSPSVLATTAALRVWASTNTSQSEPASAETSLSDSQQSQNDSCQSPTELREVPPTGETAESKVEPEETPKRATPSDRVTEDDEVDGMGGGIKVLKITKTEESDYKTTKKPRTLSENCFIGLLTALLVVHVWKSVWIIQLLPILFLFLIIKRIGAQLGSWELLRSKAKYLGEKWKETICSDQRVEILAPKPIRGLGKLILRGDRKLVAAIEKSMDQVMSILIILILMVGMVLMTFIFAVQVHRESMHLVSVTSNVLNNSLHPELSQWLPDSDEMQQTLDSMVSNAYLYGREWIANKINHAFNGDHNMQKVETQVLEVWDQLYESWFARNTTVQSEGVAMKGQMAVSLSNLTGVMDIFKNADFSLNIVAFVRENIGIVRSVLESVWLVLKGNINLALSLLTATLSVLFGGGTALLNFVLSMVVFLTSLFYLLAFSGAQYKPVEWFMSISPTQGSSGGSRFANAVEEAIGSVFAASLKMAAFYGLYTWLTHIVFGINIVFIPSALAALFAMIPFMGTYWAALPAIIELWLVKGASIQAISLFTAHLLPTYIVDTAIYSDIKGGHPYLTGLAIAGGIYWMGLEGAIIAPILLCCLIVAVNIYSTMLKPESDMTPAAKNPRVASLASTKKVHFKLQRGFSDLWQ